MHHTIPLARRQSPHRRSRQNAAQQRSSRRSKSLPLEGKVPNAVRRMRWNAHLRHNPTTTQDTNPHRNAKRKPPRRGLVVKSKPPHCHTLPAPIRCHLISRLPPTASPQGEAKISRSKSLPLEGKVPNGCEADEVERKSPLHPNHNAKRKSLAATPPKNPHNNKVSQNKPPVSSHPNFPHNPRALPLPALHKIWPLIHFCPTAPEFRPICYCQKDIC